MPAVLPAPIAGHQIDKFAPGAGVTAQSMHHQDGAGEAGRLVKRRLCLWGLGWEKGC